MIAAGSPEVLPEVPGIERALGLVVALGRPLSGRSLLVVDDGFGWWPCAGAVELGVRAGFESHHARDAGRRVREHAAARGPGAAARAPARGSARGPPLHRARRLDEDGAALRSTLSGAAERVAADTVIVVGERVARDWSALVRAPGRSA